MDFTLRTNEGTYDIEAYVDLSGRIYWLPYGVEKSPTLELLLCLNQDPDRKIKKE